MTEQHSHGPSCHRKRRSFDLLLWGSTAILAIGYLSYAFFSNEIQSIPHLSILSESIYELLNTMAWGIFLGIIFVGVLGKIPQQLVMAVLGKGGTFSGILRATAGGVLLDLCSHGILMVGMQLYRKGASLGQTMAFLIASPWNSMSLTFILWALIGLKWTLVFLALSMIIALISGLIFDTLVKHSVLPPNSNHYHDAQPIHFWREVKSTLRQVPWSPKVLWVVLRDGLLESRMVLRWIFFGVILASLVRTFVDPSSFETFFGPSLAGLGLTVFVATIIEVCSEGSTPIAADLLTRASAPGNSFAFLMTGVSTDYTEILSLKETTGSWKISLFLPLITVPQVLVIAWLMNNGGI